MNTVTILERVLLMGCTPSKLELEIEHVRKDHFNDSIFAGLHPRLKIRLASKFHFQTYEDGHTVFRAGEPADTLYVVHDVKIELQGMFCVASWSGHSFFNSCQTLVRSQAAEAYTFAYVENISKGKRNGFYSCGFSHVRYKKYINDLFSGISSGVFRVVDKRTSTKQK